MKQPESGRRAINIRRIVLSASRSNPMIYFGADVSNGDMTLYRSIYVEHQLGKDGKKVAGRVVVNTCDINARRFRVADITLPDGMFLDNISVKQLLLLLRVELGWNISRTNIKTLQRHFQRHYVKSENPWHKPYVAMRFTALPRDEQVDAMLGYGAGDD